MEKPVQWYSENGAREKIWGPLVQHSTVSELYVLTLQHPHSIGSAACSPSHSPRTRSRGRGSGALGHPRGLLLLLLLAHRRFLGGNSSGFSIRSFVSFLSTNQQVIYLRLGQPQQRVRYMQRRPRSLHSSPPPPRRQLLLLGGALRAAQPGNTAAGSPARSPEPRRALQWHWISFAAGGSNVRLSASVCRRLLLSQESSPDRPTVLLYLTTSSSPSSVHDHFMNWAGPGGGDAQQGGGDLISHHSSLNQMSRSLQNRT